MSPQKLSQNTNLFQFLEPSGQFSPIERDPKVYFPDTEASKWILSLLLSNQDIGLMMKLLAPFFESTNTQNTLCDQYRYSHMFYFWRLFCAHAHEAWHMFNKQSADALILKLKINKDIRQISQSVSDKLSFKLGNAKESPTVKTILGKCRHVTFHYGEKDGDSWEEKLKSVNQTLAVTSGDCESDYRWVIGDRYLESRLAPLNLGNTELQAHLRDAVLGIVSLIRKTVEVYFAELDEQVAKKDEIAEQRK